MSSEFESLGLLPQFVQAVEQMGFEQPTPIQLAAIPALLDGRNVVGQAQTGTGKTGAFVLPLLQQIQPGTGKIQALIMTPTRELAIQVAAATSRMARNTTARVMAVYGGQSYHIQVRQLQRGVDVVVGTPGRLLDLIRQRLLDLSQVRYLVLDEADEMLEMGFIEDVEAILAQTPEGRQIALFSATMPEAVRKLADRYVSAPQQIAIKSAQRTVAETEQRYYRVREGSKLAALTRLLEVEEVGSALIFARTKAGVQELSDELNRLGRPAEALHGDLNQSRREWVLNRFRHGQVTLLVATDVAARGLDIENVSHVINYDVPADGEDYLHRVGRTGRAGRKGIAITFLTPRERTRLNQIESYTRQPISECQMPTRETIMAQRDERFLEHLSEILATEHFAEQRKLATRLAESGVDPLDIAAAAIQLARAGEGDLPRNEVIAPAREIKPERKSDRGFKRADMNAELSKKPRKTKNGWQESAPAKGKPAARTLHIKGQHEPGMVRLKMNLGETHGLRPSDIVGAIATEAGIPGRAIGEIDIHREHTFIDIAEKHVQRVLLESGGSYFLRGKPALVKLAH